MARNGTGPMDGPEPLFAADLAGRALRSVPGEWTTTGPGYHAYDPSRRQVPTGLRLFVDLVRELRPLGP